MVLCIVLRSRVEWVCFDFRFVRSFVPSVCGFISIYIYSVYLTRSVTKISKKILYLSSLKKISKSKSNIIALFNSAIHD